MNKIIFTNIIISFIVIVSTTVIFAQTLSVTMPKQEQNIVRYETVSIEEGDCISVLAQKYNTSNMTTKQFTKYIKDFNNLKSDTIYYGNSILIPIFE